MTASFDLIIVGAGVIGCSVAFHASALGARVLLIDRVGIAEGTSSQSSGILRTHYSVPENVQMAHRSYSVFADFAAYLQDDDASCGFNRCGYLIVADEAKAAAVRISLQQQRAMGIDAQEIDAAQARELLPLLNTDGLTLFGYEPEAGYADAYLTATSFARAARRNGAVIKTGLAVTRLLASGNRVLGVDTAEGQFFAAKVITASNVWTAPLLATLHPSLATLPLSAERHEVLALEASRPYLPSYPVFKDMASESMLYARCYGASQLLVSKGLAGIEVEADEGQAEVPLDLVASIGEQLSARMPVFGDAGLASSWTGLYDVTPDWNPVLGALPSWEGLLVGFGFSGHGFKLSPVVGKVLAQAALGQVTDVNLQPYRYTRFAEGAQFRGLYGSGAVS